MSGFNKAKGQGQKAWGQVQGQAHQMGDHMQGGRASLPSGFNKAGGDFMAEMNRYKQGWQDDPMQQGLNTGAMLFPVTGGVNLYGAGRRSLGEDRHNWNKQLDPRYAENERDKERAADRQGQQAVLEQRQGMAHGGLGGGGGQANAEIQRYNQILSEYAAQQQQFKQQGLQGDMQMIALLMKLLGAGGG